MTDFHRSLDRALEREDLATPRWVVPEPLENPYIPALPNSWQTLGYLDEAHEWPATTFRETVDRITDQMIADLRLGEARAAGFAIDSTTAYDDLQDRINRAIIHRDDATITFRINPQPLRYDRSWITDLDEPVAYDGFGAPLYAHQLPAEGTE